MAERSRSTRARRWSAVPVTVGVAHLAAACVGEDVSAGRVGDVVDASRCYATNCESHPPTGTLAQPPLTTCGNGVAPFQIADDWRVEASMGSVQELALAPDGTLWVLHVSMDATLVWVEHYTREGALIGASERQALVNAARVSLIVDELGKAWTLTYVVDAGATADDDFHEQSFLRAFYADGTALEPAIPFASLAGALVISEAGGLTLAGSRTQNEQRGSVLRLDEAGEPKWIQTQLATDGMGVGVGVAGLAYRANNVVSVLSERARDFGADRAAFGIATVSDGGILEADQILQTRYLGGSPLAMAVDGNDTLYVLGPTGRMQAGSSGSFYELATLQVFPSAGAKGMSLGMTGVSPPIIAVDRATGGAFIPMFDGIAAVHGESCAIVPGPRLGLRDLEFSGDVFFYAEQWGIGRWLINGLPGPSPSPG
jgi:hypothetical protein